MATSPWPSPARSLSVERLKEFEVETDKAGELPLPFWSETVRQVVVE